MAIPDYDPYPNAETTVYRYTGTGLHLPSGATVTAGETVALPDRAATPFVDTLETAYAGTCEAVKSDGEVCGRERPCPYHD